MKKSSQRSRAFFCCRFFKLHNPKSGISNNPNKVRMYAFNKESEVKLWIKDLMEKYQSDDLDFIQEKIMTEENK